MIKQFKPFSAYVPPNFLQLLIEWQMKDENSSFEEIQEAYGEENKLLADKISCTVCDFEPDLGYACESIDGTLCFESKDMSTCIPVELLEEIK